MTSRPFWHHNTETARTSERKAGGMKGYLIEKYSNMGAAYTCRRLIEEAAKRGILLELIGVHDCVLKDGAVYLVQGRDERILKPVDFIINRFKTGLIKDAINLLGQRSYNPLKPFSIYINKYEQIKHLASPAMIMPRSILGDRGTSFDSLRRQLGLPFVAKGLESSMGREVRLIRKAGDMADLCHNPDGKFYPENKEWLFQEFIHDSSGRDMRLFCIRGRIVSAMERVSLREGDFRANVALGASVRPIPVTETFRSIGWDIYKETGLDFMGIDLLYGKEKPYFCEINVMPGIEGMEMASGLNLAGCIMDRIADDFQNNKEEAGELS